MPELENSHQITFLRSQESNPDELRRQQTDQPTGLIVVAHPSRTQNGTEFFIFPTERINQKKTKGV